MEDDSPRIESDSWPASEDNLVGAPFEWPALQAEWHCPELALTQFLKSIGAPLPWELAKRLSEEFSTIADMLGASWWRLRKVVGWRVASAIKASNSLMQAALAAPVERGPIVPSPSGLLAFLQMHVGFLQQERLLALYVDSRMHLIRFETISLGNLGSATVDNRKVISCGLECGAIGFILVHNHPSGQPEPSDADINLTNRLRALSAEFDLHLLDHLIVARGNVCKIEEQWREARWGASNSGALTPGSLS